MNTAHMTPEDWNRYFNETPSPATEYVKNLLEATKKGFVPPDVALIRCMELNHVFRDAYEQIEILDKADQRRIADSFLPVDVTGVVSGIPKKGDGFRPSSITIPVSETNNVDRT